MSETTAREMWLSDVEQTRKILALEKQVSDLTRVVDAIRRKFMSHSHTYEKNGKTDFTSLTFFGEAGEVLDVSDLSTEVSNLKKEFLVHRHSRRDERDAALEAHFNLGPEKYTGLPVK